MIVYCKYCGIRANRKPNQLHEGNVYVCKKCSLAHQDRHIPHDWSLQHKLQYMVENYAPE